MSDIPFYSRMHCSPEQWAKIKAQQPRVENKAYENWLDTVMPVSDRKGNAISQFPLNPLVIQRSAQAAVDGNGKLLRKAIGQTTTTGIVNTIFSRAVVFYQTVESNLLSIFKKVPWGTMSGKRAEIGSVPNPGKITETGTFPTALTPTLKHFGFTPKYRVFPWEHTLRAELESTGDGGADIRNLYREWATRSWPKVIDRQIGRGADTRTSSTYFTEQLDSLIGSQSEATSRTTINNNDLNVYLANTSSGIGQRGGPIKRAGTSQTSDFDSQVLHNSGTERDLTRALVDQVLRDTHKEGANRARQVFVTGFDTADDFEALFSPNERHSVLNERRVALTFNGVQTVPGGDFGVPLAAYKGVPLIRSESVENGADNTKSPLFLLDLSQIELWEMLPTVALDTTRDDFLTLNKLTTKHALLTAHELVVHNFKVQGKVTDLV